MTNYHFDTIKTQGGYDSRQHNYSVAVPIYPTAAFDFDGPDHFNRIRAGEEPGFLYSRIGNPTVAVLEQRIAALDGGTAALGVGSGMAAVSYSILAATGGHGRVLSTKQIYGGTFDLEHDIFPQLGIEFDLVDHDGTLQEWEEALTEETKAIFVESISNPGARLLDIDALAELAHRHGIILIVDNTFATPYLFRPFEHGADIIVYSATKSLNGHGNAIGGLIVESGQTKWTAEHYPVLFKKDWVPRDTKDKERSFIEAFPDFPFVSYVRVKLLAYLGAALSPYEAQLILIGLETLSERVSKQISNTRKIADWLQHRTDAVAWVDYPELEGSKYKKLADQNFPKGSGSVILFGFKGDAEQTATLLSSVRLFGYQANVGDARSLIVDPPHVTHGELRPEQQIDAGIQTSALRISLGLEDPDDLIADLAQAFTAAGFSR